MAKITWVTTQSKCIWICRNYSLSELFVKLIRTATKELIMMNLFSFSLSFSWDPKSKKWWLLLSVSILMDFDDEDRLTYLGECPLTPKTHSLEYRRYAYFYALWYKFYRWSIRLDHLELGKLLQWGPAKPAYKCCPEPSEIKW